MKFAKKKKKLNAENKENSKDFGNKKKIEELHSEVTTSLKLILFQAQIQEKILPKT